MVTHGAITRLEGRRQISIPNSEERREPAC
jgi:hypothetical protein